MSSKASINNGYPVCHREFLLSTCMQRNYQIQLCIMLYVHYNYFVYSYTFKALGAGFYGLHNADDFRKTIMQVVMQAGDADRYAIYMFEIYALTTPHAWCILCLTCIFHPSSSSLYQPSPHSLIHHSSIITWSSPNVFCSLLSFSFVMI